MKIGHYNLKIALNDLTILLYIFIYLIPFLKFPFNIVSTALIICSIILLCKIATLTLNESVHNYLLMILLALVIIWNQIYSISLNPENTWNSKLNKIITPLSGNNVEIVPFRAKGYLLDSSCDSLVKNDTGVFKINFEDLKVKKGDSLLASVYCFVSNDFNGNAVRSSLEGAVYGNNVSDFILFDLRNEKVNLTNNLFNNGDLKMGLTNWIPNADSTTHTIIETPFGKGIRVSRSDGDGGWWSLRYAGRKIIYRAGHRYQIRFKYKIQKGEGTPFQIGWWVKESNGFLANNLPLEVNKLKNGWKQAICYYRFKQEYYDLVTFLNDLQDYSIVDIANIELRDLDINDSIPLFVDQLNNKGTWQKLTIKVPCNTGKVSFCFSISKNSLADSVKGYVILASPECEKIN